MRLAVAMVCVGISLILAGQWLGLVPDAHQVMLEARKRQCEVIGVNSIALIRGKHWNELDATLRAMVVRDPQLLSIGVRTKSGYLRLQTDNHEELWREANQDSKRGPGFFLVEVPMTLNRYPWGQLEICYEGDRFSGMMAVADTTLFRLLVFFSAVGLGSYSIIAFRILRSFDSSKVVPERVRQALDTFAEGLLVLDEEHRIVVCNKAFLETTRMDIDDLIGRDVTSLPWLPEADQELVFPWLRTATDDTAPMDVMLHYCLPDGNECIFSVNSSPIEGSNGKQRGTLATFRDVTLVEEQRRKMQRMVQVLQVSRDEIRQKNQELIVLATEDSLTGCLNRRAFFEQLGHVWTNATENNQPLSCIMVDNDHFKRVNDTYGHHAGDEVLRQVSGLLRSMHAPDDLVCRYGGEEFCIVLPGRDARVAEQHAEQIRLRIGALSFPDYPDLKVTASLGIADLTYQPRDPQELINQADRCLYVAKNQGRNRVIVYLPQFAAMELAPSERELDKPVDQTAAVPFQAVTALVSALAFRDADTAEHSRRVADLVVAASEGLLDQRQTYILETAALLHDIGKIGVPDHILLKPGKLTSDEWKLMNKHDRIGVEIVAGAFNCEELSEIIRTHRAFYGGDARDRGLPRGIEIPIGARLLTICDSYDAITSDRPYRKGQSHEAAIAELRRCSGTQFDPGLVEHFITAIENRQRPQEDGDLVVPKQTALQLGLQIERLAAALDERDAEGLNALASRVAQVARRNGVDKIAEAAEKLENDATDDDADWLTLMGTTVDLLELCRSAQNAFLKSQHEPFELIDSTES